MSRLDEFERSVFMCRQKSRQKSDFEERIVLIKLVSVKGLLKGAWGARDQIIADERIKVIPDDFYR